MTMTDIHNILLPEFFFEYMEHWSGKQVKAMIFAVSNYAFNGELPVFDKFDEDTNKTMAKHFELVKGFIDKTQKTYNIKRKTYNQRLG